MPIGEKSIATPKQETYEEYCLRCKKHSVEPIPLVKWIALNDVKKFKFVT